METEVWALILENSESQAGFSATLEEHHGYPDDFDAGSAS